MKVSVTKNYVVIKANGEVINLMNKSGDVVKRSFRKTYVQFKEGLFPILNVALKKEAL